MTVLFVIFSIFIFIFTSTLILTTWSKTKEKAHLELQYTNQIVSTSFETDLRRHEILLRLLGNRLLDINVLQEPEKVVP